MVELLVSVAVLVLLVTLMTRLFNSGVTVTTDAGKRMGADAQARALFDRLQLDFTNMFKRADLDYYLKQPGNAQSGNDQIAFYSGVPGYYPLPHSQSPLSLVAYRVNAGLPRVERLGKGLLWNGAAGDYPSLVFLPKTIATIWPSAAGLSQDSDYETIGADSFRFEYYYTLKGRSLPDGTTTSSVVSETPWDDRLPGHTKVDGLRDVLSITVAIAVVDAKSKELVSEDQLETLASQMNDFELGHDFTAQWQSSVDASTIPPAAKSAVRVYTRTLSLNQETY